MYYIIYYVFYYFILYSVMIHTSRHFAFLSARIYRFKKITGFKYFNLSKIPKPLILEMQFLKTFQQSFRKTIFRKL